MRTGNALNQFERGSAVQLFFLGGKYGNPDISDALVTGHTP